MRSNSIHSRYTRYLQDLPWQGVRVRLRLTARRFRCRNASCGQRIFVERLPEVAQVYARQTNRLREIVRSVGFVAGGLPGARLLARLAITVSDDTVLRTVKLRPRVLSDEHSIRCLGVDDWAWRKGQDYGTILVDLERHRVVDLLPDRSAESFADWLMKNPTVSVISRDRSGLYAEGAERGAPAAQQVADRFHLVLNLSAAIERALEERAAVADSGRRARQAARTWNGESAAEIDTAANIANAAPSTAAGPVSAGIPTSSRRTFTTDHQPDMADHKENSTQVAARRSISGAYAGRAKAL